MANGTDLPRWDLGPIYASFDAVEYRRDLELLTERSAALLALLEQPLPPESAAVAARVSAMIALIEEAGDLDENLGAYAQAVYTTDTRNARALAEINALEERSLPLAKAAVLFRTRLAERRELVMELAASGSPLSRYSFFLRESITRAEKQMPVELEDLANDLGRSGGDAWSRLQEAISSTVSAPWDAESGERKTVIALRSLAFDQDRLVREKAYRAELAAWKAVEIPMAASINGVKGWAITVDGRRGWEGALDKAAFQGRVSRKTLDALISAMEESLPLFRRYLAAKARLLKVPSCAFFDLFAPVGDSGRKWTWTETGDYIVQRFASFDPLFGTFARHAFAFNWIDAESREGKVGGAYCTDFPIKGDSRILCNFEGSFSSVTTVAHELGHAWHHELIKELPRTLSAYPMTLAETASIFAETIVFEGALAGTSGPERLGLIEGNLQDSCQVIVDILSRFRFERALFDRRSEGELSSEELCALMTEAQKSTYGDGLDAELLHPYMWAVKGHYYSPDLAFYNFPYAFGLLFALALYARAEKEGPSFAAAYRELLRRTGRETAAEVASSAGFDIEGIEFWRSGVSVIAARIEEFEHMVKAAGL
jgi:pepF/M3 family oligoendopeptidase